jgi:hypothetical protein
MAMLHYYNPQSERRQHHCKNLKAKNLNRKSITTGASAMYSTCNVQDHGVSIQQTGNTAEVVLAGLHD